MPWSKLHQKDRLFLGFLGILATFIWLRNLDWISTFDDTLPILVSIPLFFWLAEPWEFHETYQAPSTWTWLGAILLFLPGIATGFTILMALGWCWLLWGFIKARVPSAHHSRMFKLMILPLMAFPWVTLDAGAIGWWFRLTGTWVTGHLFTGLGYMVKIEGTMLHINGLPISVEPACSGLNTLQSMLISGSVMAFIMVGDRSRYWLNLPLLVGISWIANTLRVIALSTASVWVSPEFAMGAFHDFGGWLILVIVFLLSWGLFALQSPKQEADTKVRQ